MPLTLLKLRLLIGCIFEGCVSVERVAGKAKSFGCAYEFAVKFTHALRMKKSRRFAVDFGGGVAESARFGFGGFATRFVNIIRKRFEFFDFFYKRKGFVCDFFCRRNVALRRIESILAHSDIV